ncbi:TPA: DHH family phosphoesterase [Clostridium botulinum]|nr:DHH family phosphoesterase [Clostridium botulinum]HDK7206367.1 DHH family phosphoesterase [Clostridium botulinum]HDK7210103.1 DHH family phosphoesterase [Clostridium botulinum]HDK7265552.1 DHH family phosphoesterase [Clostridium botulinum]HDK7269400.1 DHH family phosphoesterase [Clostridium botulinum]
MKYKIKEPKIKFDKDDNIIDKILKIRGIKNKEEFLFPSKDVLHSYWELSDMKEAVKTTTYAIQNNFKIGIYGDIDTDGVTSLAIIYHYLKKYNINPINIYHQRKDGHGVIVDNIPKDLDLLIIVDSSTNSVKECKELSKNMNIIILDHHESDKKNPYAIIVNPQINDYPNKYLSGAGVCYKFCQAIDEVLEKDYAKELIDLCAIGLIGDMMNVAELETRRLILEGIFKIHNNCNMQLKLLLKHLKKDYKPNTTDISFYVVPFINSIIRLNQIEDAITILTSDDEKNIKDTIKRCNKLNNQRKEIQAELVKKVEKKIDNSHKTIFVIMDELEEENKTLNGLVANNIMHKYKKPTFILSSNKEKNTYVGSGRSLGSADIRELINNCSLSVEAEGHEGAFGIEVKKEELEDLINLLDENLKNINYDDIALVDLELNQNEITWDLLRDISKLNFIVGEGFKTPQFLIKYLFRTDAKIMKDIHVKLQTNDLDCLKFNLSESEVNRLYNAFCFDVIGSLSINSWYNFKTKKAEKTKQVLISDINIY